MCVSVMFASSLSSMSPFQPIYRYPDYYADLVDQRPVFTDPNETGFLIKVADAGGVVIRRLAPQCSVRRCPPDFGPNERAES